MSRSRILVFSLLAAFACAANADDVVQLKLKPEGIPEANYNLWIPPGVATLRGVIVHQHGCGEGAERGGETAAWDTQWRALAAKWDCALLGPNYHAEGDCLRWCDPANGSDAAFNYALKRLGELSGHAELETVPWVLWGHSGGATWAHWMTLKYPERVIATVLRSGSAYALWTDGKQPKPPFHAETLYVPILCNVGLREKTDKRFHRAWDVQMELFNETREKGGFVAFAPDPTSSHNCSQSRYLAIPFIDACLNQRLPAAGAPPALPRMDPLLAWAGHNDDLSIQPLGEFSGDKTTVSWLPDERVANAWKEYVTTGTVKDFTPPTQAPTNLQAKRQDKELRLTWQAAPDLQSGIGGFVVYLEGEEVSRLGDPRLATQIPGQFQPVSYHDTPEAPLRPFEVTLPFMPGLYTVATLNGNNQESPQSDSVIVKY